MDGRIEVVTPAAALIDTETAKAWLRITSNSEDTSVDLAVAAATAAVERYLNMALAPRTVDVWFDAWSNKLQLPSPLRSVQSITYYDANDNATVWPADAYRVNTVALAPFVWPVDVWPSAPLRDHNGIAVRCDIGYAGVADVPSDYKMAILALASTTWINRDGLDASGARLLDRIELNVRGAGAALL